MGNAAPIAALPAAAAATAGGGDASREAPLPEAAATTALVGAKWSESVETRRDTICRLCGGAACRHEDWRRQRTPAAIKGLHSSWVTKDIIASQRPSSRLIREHEVVRQFKALGVNAVINLQEPGEHAQCGDGICESGFAYHPERDLMEHGVFHYALGWVDLGVPPLERMLDIMRVLHFSLRERREKVLVHCHAGLGRTGLVIASWLVFGHSLAHDHALQIVRARRQGAVQTRSQVEFLRVFEGHVRQLRRVCIVPPIVGEPPLLSVASVLAQQRRLLHGDEARTLRHVPRIVHVTTRALLRVQSDELARALLRPGQPSWGNAEEEALSKVKRRLNADDWVGLELLPPPLLAQLLLDWLETLAEPLLPHSLAQRVLAEADGVTAESLRLVPAAHSGAVDEVMSVARHALGVGQQDGEMSWQRAARGGGEAEEAAARLCERLAYALMHPRILLPYPRPFRTLRVTVADAGDAAPVSGVIQQGSFESLAALRANGGEREEVDEEEVEAEAEEPAQPLPPTRRHSLRNSGEEALCAEAAATIRRASRASLGVAAGDLAVPEEPLPAAPSATASAPAPAALASPRRWRDPSLTLLGRFVELAATRWHEFARHLPRPRANAPSVAGPAAAAAAAAAATAAPHAVN